jgi:hypothetical protein
MEELDLVLRRDSNNVLTTMHDKLEKDSKRTSSCSNKMEYSPAYRTTLRFGVMFSILIVILGLLKRRDNARSHRTIWLLYVQMST